LKHLATFLGLDGIPVGYPWNRKGLGSSEINVNTMDPIEFPEDPPWLAIFQLWAVERAVRRVPLAR